MCGSARPRASSKCCRRGQILAECTLGGLAESSGLRGVPRAGARRQSAGRVRASAASSSSCQSLRFCRRAIRTAVRSPRSSKKNWTPVRLPVVVVRPGRRVLPYRRHTSSRSFVLMGVRTHPESPRLAARPDPQIEQAALRTVAYADVFDYPLHALEVHRYLHGTAATMEATEAALARCSAPGGALGSRDGLYTLRGRESLVAVRDRRAAVADRLWPAALTYGRLIAG